MAESDSTPLSKQINAGIEGGPKPSQLPPKSGLYHTVNLAEDAETYFKRAQNEKVMKNAGAYIVLGTDRPASDRDGYGAWGADKAASIDLVVGRMAAAQGGKGPDTPAWVDNSFSADAARIHISQLTDVDRHFDIPPTTQPNAVARSAIGIKADAVRVIGREGVKIVSGGGQNTYGNAGETNSQGAKIHQPSPEIAFIAGNSTEDRVTWGGLFNPRETIKGLQPLCLGYVTRDAFAEIAEVVDQILSIVLQLAVIQEFFNSILGIDPWRSWIAPASVSANAMEIGFVNMSAWLLKVNLMLFNFNYLNAFGYKFICSTNVKTT